MADVGGAVSTAAGMLNPTGAVANTGIEVLRQMVGAFDENQKAQWGLLKQEYALDEATNDPLFIDSPTLREFIDNEEMMSKLSPRLQRALSESMADAKTASVSISQRFSSISTAGARAKEVGLATKVVGSAFIALGVVGIATGVGAPAGLLALAAAGGVGIYTGESAGYFWGAHNPSQKVIDINIEMFKQMTLVTSLRRKTFLGNPDLEKEFMDAFQDFRAESAVRKAADGEGPQKAMQWLKQVSLSAMKLFPKVNLADIELASADGPQAIIELLNKEYPSFTNEQKMGAYKVVVGQFLDKIPPEKSYALYSSYNTRKLSGDEVGAWAEMANSVGSIKFSGSNVLASFFDKISAIISKIIKGFADNGSIFKQISVPEKIIHTDSSFNPEDTKKMSSSDPSKIIANSQFTPPRTKVIGGDTVSAVAKVDEKAIGTRAVGGASPILA